MSKDWGIVAELAYLFNKIMLAAELFVEFALTMTMP